jgi:hypothetical protein
MTVLIWGMLLALLIPIAVVCQPRGIWERMAAFSERASAVRSGSQRPTQRSSSTNCPYPTRSGRC